MAYQNLESLQNIYKTLKFPLHLSEDEDAEEAAREGNTAIAEFLRSCK